MVWQNEYEGTNYSIAEIIDASLQEGLKSMLMATVLAGIRIPGFNAGRNSVTAISKQIYKKIANDTIKKISHKTLGKLVQVQMYGSIFDFILIAKGMN